ncbi:hypothetical protein J7F03_33755 [Streptomyces sp. ISL-43]|uniref:hypothetical protein n=1 Tax=Streptomyces sp. ISL-43 TaxID=2819183 RepID=UPI001BE6D7CC|nr:hypothetical protein [Streptomyces sp. ISL-43]MBT2451941.1 hypothetical protein [Streptomyces sp. ISL-43]
MRPVRTAAAAAALIGPLLLATGCGSIATTGVVESGRAGTVKLATGPETGIVYFVPPEGGLVPVALLDGPSHPSPNYLITRLLAGPDSAAQEVGLTSALPAVETKRVVATWLTISDDGTSVQIKLPFPVGPLSATARRQVACTALAGVRITPTPEVTLTDAEGKEERADCAVPAG